MALCQQQKRPSHTFNSRWNAQRVSHSITNRKLQKKRKGGSMLIALLFILGIGALLFGSGVYQIVKTGDGIGKVLLALLCFFISFIGMAIMAALKP